VARFFMPNPASTFKFFVPFTGAYVEKGTNKMIVEGLASTTEVDLTGERMAESAIKSMAASNLPLSFRSEHKSEWDSELGAVTSLTATADHQLLMKAELDADHPNAHFLFGKLQKGSQLGLSIGGQVNDWAWEHDATIGKAIRTYKDIALQEVSVTSHPAVASTFLSAINKSLHMKESAMDKHPAVEKTDQVVPAPNEGQPVELEPADSVIAEEIVDGQSGVDVANPIEQATNVAPVTVQPAPADQPAAAPETPHTPGDSATPEQVAAQEDKTPANEVTEPVAAPVAPVAPAATVPSPTTPTNPVVPTQTPLAQPNDAAGSQEAHSTESTQPDATPHTEKSVAKAVYLGEYAETEATVGVIDDLADRLTSAVWNTIGDDTMDAATQKATIDATLTEFHSLVMKVATVLIDADAASDAVEAAKSYQETRITLAKSLDATASELATVKKALADRSVTLSEKEAELTAAKLETHTVQEALTTMQEALSDAQAAAQKEQARKSYQIASKFDTALNMAAKTEASDLDKTFAAFITGK
jgi:HK97 family phage prohead protease